MINYNLGKEIVGNYIERKMGKSKDSKKRWQIFESLISLPQTPSGLMK